MKSIFISAAIAALAAPVYAQDDTAWGGFNGSVSSISKSGGIAATGGLAAGGANGTSFVRNEQFSANLSGVTGNLEFDDSFGQNGPGDGINVDLSVQTLNEGVQESRTVVRDRGTGTAGLGGGLAKSGGIAVGDGTMGAFGFDSW